MCAHMHTRTPTHAPHYTHTSHTHTHTHTNSHTHTHTHTHVHTHYPIAGSQIHWKQTCITYYWKMGRHMWNKLVIHNKQMSQLMANSGNIFFSYFVWWKWELQIGRVSDWNKQRHISINMYYLTVETDKNRQTHITKNMYYLAAETVTHT